MNQDQWNNFTLFLIAFGFLIVSFIQPFMYANFEPEIPKEVLLAKDMVYTGDSLGGFIGVKPSVFLERFLGISCFPVNVNLCGILVSKNGWQIMLGCQ